MIPPLQSLVRYDNPVLVSTSKDKGKGGKGTPGKKVRTGRRHACTHATHPLATTALRASPP